MHLSHLDGRYWVLGDLLFGEEREILGDIWEEREILGDIWEEIKE